MGFLSRLLYWMASDTSATLIFSLKLIQKDVARIIGVDDTSIWNWENNQSRPVSRLIPKIWEFLGYCPVNLRADNN
jgi:DNA-binding XRE family transcriptional regulator